MKFYIILLFSIFSFASFGQVGNNNVGQNITPACTQICDGNTNTTITGAMPATWSISNIVLQSGAITDTYSGTATTDVQLESQLKNALDNHAGAGWSVFDVTGNGGVGTVLSNLTAEFQGSTDALFSFDLTINGTASPIGFSTNCYFSSTDCSSTNELQYISLEGTTVTLSENGGELDLSAFVSEVTNTVTGNTIATHDSNGTLTDIDETITDFGTPIVDTSDPSVTEVTLPYNQEGGTTQDVIFELPAPISCVDFKGTRAQVLALRNAGTLETQCHYIITDYSRGTIGAVQIILHATDIDELSQEAMFSVRCDNSAWSGRYDIDDNRIIEMRDNLGNVVTGDFAVDAFEWCNRSVIENKVFESTLIYKGGNFRDNELTGNATVTVSAGNVERNYFGATTNTTISAGDFRENRVESDATVISSTTGDVESNYFKSNSNSSISGASNFDNSEVETDGNITISGGSIQAVKIGESGNLTMSGGTLSDTKVGEDADVIIIGGSNYENVFGNSTIYRQVGTGYIRYSTIEGTTTWVNGNTNVSNVQSYVSTVNTTGSTGTISNTHLNRAFCLNMQNISSLTITDCNIKSYSQITANNAARIYFYRSSLSDYSYLTVSAGSRIDASYTNLDAYSYLQSNQSGGFLTVNYCKLSGVSYIRNTTPNTHRAERCVVGAQSNIRFDGNATGGRVYYSAALGGGAIYQTTGSVNNYIYYCTANSVGQIYTQNSTNARIYYSNASSRGYVRSIGNAATHYMYYCNASASGYVQALNNTGTVRMYAVNASSQSIAELRNSANSNLYYSNFDAYFYAYITRTGGTSSGLFGMGRRSQVVTNPIPLTPFATGAAWLNF